MKKGISLIVLVITIIVMIIIAATVVISLSNTGIIDRANEAVDASNIKEVQHIATLTWSEAYLDGKRGDELKTVVLEVMSNYEDDYDFEVTDKGVTVTKANGETQPEDEQTRLEGDGQEYDAAAPATLSFRSIAPLSEFKEVQVNGETVASANYTLTEGSTIVTFTTDYLNTLVTGTYVVTIVSESMSVIGSFTVKENESSNEQVPAPGLYRTGSNYTELITSWSSLVASGSVEVEGSVLKYVSDELSGDLCIANGITSLDYYTFCLKKLTGVWFPEGFSYVGGETFYNCENLNHIIFPESLTGISFTFVGFPNLKTVKYEGTQAQWEAVSGREYVENIAGVRIECTGGADDQPVQIATCTLTNPQGYNFEIRHVETGTVYTRDMFSDGSLTIYTGEYTCESDPSELIFLYDSSDEIINVLMYPFNGSFTIPENTHRVELKCK